jgi:tetratricopeptide (TPR) repeat protein
MSTKLAELMHQAAKKLERLDYGAVILLYQKALALAPSNAGATMGLVMVFNRVGRPTEALALLQKLWPSAQAAKGVVGKRFKAAVLAQIGLAQEQLGQLPSALDSYGLAQRLADNPQLQQHIDQIQSQLLRPEPVRQLLLHARQLEVTGKSEQALTAYAAVLKLHPDNVEALRGLASLYRQRGALEDALAPLQKALVLAPDRPELYNELGMVFQDLGDLRKAVTFHKRAIKVDERFTSAHINLGVAYKRLGKHAEAIAAYRAALALNPQSPEAHNNLGNLLHQIGDISGAKRHIEDALRLRPNYPDAQTNLISLRGTSEPAARPKISRGDRHGLSR